jgi:hypothetical protein
MTDGLTVWDSASEATFSIRYFCSWTQPTRCVDAGAPPGYPRKALVIRRSGLFAALDPCRSDGDRCTSGVDCCGGYCYVAASELVEPEGTCSPKMNTCSMVGDSCSAASDCCPPADPNELSPICIAGFCTQVRGPD